MRHIEDFGKLHQKTKPGRGRDEHQRDVCRIHGEDASDPESWDTKGLSSWAMSRFQVNLSQSQIRKTDSHELEERLRVAAIRADR